LIINNFNKATFNGYRGELNIAATFGVDIGGSMTFAVDSYGSILIGMSASVGIGLLPTLLNGNYNFGYTKIH